MSATNEQMIAFVGVSSLLTGVAADKLAPALDPVNIKTVYLDFLLGSDPVRTERLLEIYTTEKAAGKSDAQIAAAIFAADVAWFSRSVMLMWYLGSWYTPESLADYAKAANSPPADPSCPAPPFPPGGSVIVSATGQEAYTQGWSWNVAQAHPMGYSNLRFGYWANNPPTLQQFVGGGQ